MRIYAFLNTVYYLPIVTIHLIDSSINMNNTNHGPGPHQGNSGPTPGGNMNQGYAGHPNHPNSTNNSNVNSGNINNQPPQNNRPMAFPRPMNSMVGVSQFFPSTKPHPSVPYTAEEFMGVLNTLDKTLGPEYVSSRPGAGGTSVAYIEGWKALNIANEIFGFNGWSSELVGYTLDYCDTLRDGRVSMGLSVVVRVTIKDGTYHEDIGYGHIDNAKNKAAAYEKCKKEALTDGVKRCLRCFGNVLGNCLYDKALMAKLKTVQRQQTEIQDSDLYRDDTFVKLQAQRQKTARVNIMPSPNSNNNNNTNTTTTTTNNAPAENQNKAPTPQNTTSTNANSNHKPSTNNEGFKTPKQVNPSQDEFDDSFLFSDEVDMNRTDEFEMEMIMNKSDKENEEPGVANANAKKLESNTNEPQIPSVVEQPEHEGPALFISAKSADLLKTTPTANLPLFDPKFVSPSIRRTLDPTKSVPVKRSDISTSQTPSKLGPSNNINLVNTAPNTGTKRMVGMPLAGSRPKSKRLHKE